MPACPACGADQPTGKKFCRNCGTALTAAPAPPPVPSEPGIACPACAKPSPAGARFCRNCGTVLAAAAPPPEAPRVASPEPIRTPPAAVPEPVATPEPVRPPPVAAAPQPVPRAVPVPPAKAPAKASEPSAPPPRAPEPEILARPETAAAREGGGKTGMIVGIAAVLALMFAGGWYFVRSKSPAVSSPDEAVLTSGLASSLPVYVKLTALHIQSTERIGTAAEPAFKTGFRSALVLAADTFTQASAEDGAVILAPTLKKDATRDVDGTAISRLSAGEWKSEFSLDPAAMAALGRPREAFPGDKVLVQGSPEEVAFREEQQKRREAAQQTARAQPEAPPAAAPIDLAPAPAAAPATRPPAAAAQTERTPAAAARGAAAAKAQLEAQQRDEAARDAERKKAEAEAEAQRREEAARATAAEAERRRAEEAAARLVDIPVGTETNVRLSTKLNSGNAKVEDRFEATTVDDLVIKGRTAVPAGAIMRGVVSSVQAAGRLHRTANMTLAFDQLTINGRAYPIRARVMEAIATKAKGEVAKVGAGAGIGGLIGGILGGGKGVAAGILIGGGGTMAATEGKQVDLPPGTVLRTRMDAAVQIQIQ